jgi:hypothetical protein
MISVDHVHGLERRLAMSGGTLMHLKLVELSYVSVQHVVVQMMVGGFNVESLVLKSQASLEGSGAGAEGGVAVGLLGMNVTMIPAVRSLINHFRFTPTDALSVAPALSLLVVSLFEKIFVFEGLDLHLFSKYLDLKACASWMFVQPHLSVSTHEVEVIRGDMNKFIVADRIKKLSSLACALTEGRRQYQNQTQHTRGKHPV